MTEPVTDIKEMKKTTEAVLFAAGHPMTYEKLSRLFGLTPKKTKDFITEYAKEYNACDRAIIMLWTNVLSCAQKRNIPPISKRLLT